MAPGVECTSRERVLKISPVAGLEPSPAPLLKEERVVRWLDSRTHVTGLATAGRFSRPTPESRPCASRFSTTLEQLRQLGDVDSDPPCGGFSRGGPALRDRMAAWLRWILGLITPPISPRLPA